MNDNNSSDRLTVRSYCAQFDMGRRYRGYILKVGNNHEDAGLKLYMKKSLSQIEGSLKSVEMDSSSLLTGRKQQDEDQRQVHQIS